MKKSTRPLRVNSPARRYFFPPAILFACFLLSSCLPSFSRPAPDHPRQADSLPARQHPAPAIRSAVSEIGDAASASSVCLSLALPLQGPARSIAEKITAGASAAKREMESREISVQVRLLDTDQPDWLNQLASLPPECALVGGPIHTTAYSAAKNSPAARGRAFFTFLPQLEPGSEGFSAWRFFPSHQDQADALLSFAQIEMGFSSYGVLYPDNAYGKRMAEIFRQRAALRGAAAQAAAYAPDAAAGWPNAAAGLVGRREINKTPFPTANLQAIFMPDSWSSAEQLLTSLHYNGEDRALLLGDSLWGEGILNKPPSMPQNYQLAIFPGPWNPASATPGAQSLHAALQGASPDFWLALGHDFLHFAAHMKLAGGWTPQLVNQRAADARHIAWSMAPITWDAQGKATQHLFVFSPVAGGFAPAQPNQLKSAWQDAQTRFAERLRMAQGEESVPALLAPPQTTLSPLSLSRPAIAPLLSAPAAPASGAQLPAIRQAAPSPDTANAVEY